MITARHAPWAHALFRRYVAHLIAGSFRTVSVMGPVPLPDARYPVVLVPNHSTWWDGFFVYEANRLLFKRRLHLMMLTSQLKRYPFFSRVGAFGIEPGVRSEVLASLRYSASILNNPANLLCLFPQGELRPGGLRPLGFQRGLERILSLAGRSVLLVPMAIRVELLDGQRPDVFFGFGESRVVGADSFPGIPWLEAEVSGLLDGIVRAVSRGERGTRIRRGRPGIQELWDALRGRRC